MYETSLLHKLFAALSLITLQAIILVFRNAIQPPFTYLFAVAGLGSYALGVAGFILAFTTVTIIPTSGLEKRSSSSPHLHTGHGLAGLVFFLCLYVLVPIWMLVTASVKRLCRPYRLSQAGEIDRGPANAEIVVDEKSEQSPGPSRSAPQSVHNNSPPSSPRLRTQSWGPSSLWRRSLEAGFSSDSESVTSGAPRAFEVVNRPPRLRQASGGIGPVEVPRPASRSLGEIDWLLRRRSLNLVVRWPCSYILPRLTLHTFQGELDYALTQAHHARQSTPGTGDILLAPADDLAPPVPAAKLPTASQICLDLFMQASFLGLNILMLIALWTHALKVFFILFLIWTIAFYVLLLFFAWNYRPRVSILSTVFYRLRNPPSTHFTSERSSAPFPRSPSTPLPMPFHNGGPYLHHPPYRTAATDEYSTSHAGPRSAEADEDDDIDEVTRQRMIEEEMDRREVSIVTVPKRRLWVANPS